MTEPTNRYGLTARASTAGRAGKCGPSSMTMESAFPRAVPEAAAFVAAAPRTRSPRRLATPRKPRR